MGPCACFSCGQEMAQGVLPQRQRRRSLELRRAAVLPQRAIGFRRLVVEVAEEAPTALYECQRPLLSTTATRQLQTCARVARHLFRPWFRPIDEHAFRLNLLVSSRQLLPTISFFPGFDWAPVSYLTGASSTGSSLAPPFIAMLFGLLFVCCLF